MILLFIGFIFSTNYIIYDIGKNKRDYFKKVKLNSNLNKDDILLFAIKNIFKKDGKININKIETHIKKFKLIKGKINHIIHIGFTLDPGYILQTMLTVTSIMATQDTTTKIIFHFGVINNFTAENMLKMYELRHKINNLTEFNFYYLKGAMEKMKNFHYSGEACPGKFELPELLSDNVKRLLIFDAGDVLIFRDLNELFNYNMKNYWALGNPEPIGISLCSNYNITKYINIGSLLLNVKQLKKVKFWDKYTKNRNLKLRGAPDQALFNILVPDNKKDYFPFKFGGISLFNNDKDSDNLIFNDFGLEKWLKSNLSNSFPNNPKNIFKSVAQMYNSYFIHQISYKWYKGSGLSIYRHLAKYFIKLAGIWDELCTIKPGYCQ